VLILGRFKDGDFFPLVAQIVHHVDESWAVSVNENCLFVTCDSGQEFRLLKELREFTLLALSENRDGSHERRHASNVKVHNIRALEF